MHDSLRRCMCQAEEDEACVCDVPKQVELVAPLACRCSSVVSILRFLGLSIVSACAAAIEELLH